MTETTLAEQLAAMNTKADAYIATLPPELAALIRPLKVGRRLADALEGMEQAVYRSAFDMANASASAFLCAALLYGDLEPSDFEFLSTYQCDLYRRAATF